jgi:hypothetical protein
VQAACITPEQDLFGACKPQELAVAGGLKPIRQQTHRLRHGPARYDAIMLKIDIAQVETVAKELYVRALKLLPPDIKAGFARLSATET